MYGIGGIGDNEELQHLLNFNSPDNSNSSQQIGYQSNIQDALQGFLQQQQQNAQLAANASNNIQQQQQQQLASGQQAINQQQQQQAQSAEMALKLAMMFI